MDDKVRAGPLESASALTVLRRFEGQRTAEEVLTALVRLHSGKESSYGSAKN